jgi:NitT/TauT family transport system substrate-binding protein
MADGRLRAGVVLLLTACSGAPRERITLGTGHWPAFGLVFIAEANGYFAARGLTVEQRRFATGRDAIAALASGEVDAATSYETPVALRASRDDLRVLTTLHTSSRNTWIVARADRGIARAEDLVGKRVGVPQGTNLEYFVHTVLAHAGVEGSARVIDVAPPEAVEALAAGELDAIATSLPYTDRARRAVGAAHVVEIGSDVYAEISVLAVRGATHRARRPALVKLVAALADAERLVRERPEHAFAAVRAEFPDVSEPELRDAWERITPSLGVTHELAAVLEREAAWFRSRGRAQGPPLDVGTVLDPDVLNEVDPEAVTFVSPPSAKAR